MPAAKPAPLKLLNGRGNGKDSAGRPVPVVPKFNRGAPDAPEWLDDEARAEWERVAPELERLDLLKPADRAALTAYCETWSRYVSAVAEYKANGLTLANPDSGRIGKNPAVAIAEAASAQLRTYASEFGLTPASEQNLGKKPAGDSGEEADPFAAAPTG